MIGAVDLALLLSGFALSASAGALLIAAGERNERIRREASARAWIEAALAEHHANNAAVGREIGGAAR